MNGVVVAEEPGEWLSGLDRTLREVDAQLDERHLHDIDALPAHIVLVDTQGRRLSTQEGGRQLDCFNPLTDTNYGLGVGMTFGSMDAPASSEGASQISRLAAGVRSVLTAKSARFCCEYVCRSNVEERWYLVTVTPMNADYPTGAAIVYLDISAQKIGRNGPRCSGTGMDAMVDGIVLISRAGMRLVHVNDAACRLLDRTRDQLLTLGPEEALGLAGPDLADSFDFLIETGVDSEPVEVLRPRADGSASWIETRRRAQYTGEGWTILTFLRDVTERKLAENRIARLNRVHAMLNGVNTVIVHEPDRKNLMKKTCRIAVQDGGLRLSMMALLDPKTAKVVPVGLACKDRKLRNLVRNMPLAGEGISASMIKRVIREKRAVVSSDPQLDPDVAFAGARAGFGVRTMAVLPLVIANRVIGILSLYADEGDFFQDEEIRLLGELTNAVASAIDHIEKRERLDYLASYDVVTGLANRSLFTERVAQILRLPARGDQVHAVLLIDVHDFRNVNDSFGRGAGDALLRQVAEWLAAQFERTDLVSRVGVDHFAVLLPEIVQDEFVLQVERLITGFASHPFLLNKVEFRIAVRVGVALYPYAGLDADSLLKHAETALKKAKSSGDRSLFYTRQMSEAVAGKLTLASRLHQALDKDQFVLLYQPKMHLASGRITGVEALIRWNDPQTGLVMPDRFIGILEEKGMIREVGRWVLRKAVADHLRWRHAGLNPVRIAVNVSPLQLRNLEFVREVEQAIGVDPLAAAGLELEMTETLVMEDIKHNIECLETIRGLGVKLAIDDFGTGFSSLSYLAKLPVHTLKIDRSFIRDMTNGPEAIALVSTIIKLGHSMNLNVVAEGVETEQQSRLLRLLKCDEVQGYLSSMPLSSKIFEARFLQALQTA